MDQGIDAGADRTLSGLARATRPIALVERLDRDGHVLRADPVFAWPVSLGRALDCDVVLDDPHVAPQHAELHRAPQGLELRLGETVNGAQVGALQVDAGQHARVAGGEVWRLGTTRLRVRLASDPLAPEQPLTAHARASAAPHLAGAPGWQLLSGLLIVVMLWTVGEQWLSADPGTPPVQYLGNLLISVLGLGGWALLWALGTKLFVGRLHYWTHLHLALRYTVVWAIATRLLPMLAFVTGWTALSRVADTVGVVIVWALVLAHLKVLLPGRQRMLATAMTAMLVTGIGLQAWFNHQRSGRWFSELYTAALLPPVLRLAPAAPRAALLDDARRLQPDLDKQAREDEEDAPAAEDD